MGLILLVVNVVLVSLIKVSYDTDSRIKLREEMEFGLEVIRRNAKSSRPGSVTVEEDLDELDGEKFHSDDKKLIMDLAEVDATVTFHLQGGKDDGYLVAEWTIGGNPGQVVVLTSSDDINVKDFHVTLAYNPNNGTTEITITMTADSVRRGAHGEALIKNSRKQSVIFTRHSEI